MAPVDLSGSARAKLKPRRRERPSLTDAGALPHHSRSEGRRRSAQEGARYCRSRVGAPAAGPQPQPQHHWSTFVGATQEDPFSFPSQPRPSKVEGPPVDLKPTRRRLRSFGPARVSLLECGTNEGTRHALLQARLRRRKERAREPRRGAEDPLHPSAGPPPRHDPVRSRNDRPRKADAGTTHHQPSSRHSTQRVSNVCFPPFVHTHLEVVGL